MAKYIDADVLKEEVRRLIAQYAGDTREFLMIFEDLIKEMPAADVEPVRKWIPCSEMLPENDLEVLAYYKYDAVDWVTIANFADGIWYDCIFNRVCFEVTHWMPLPEPPKMDGGSE